MLRAILLTAVLLSCLAACERKLTGSEVGFAAQYLGQNIDYDAVRIRRGGVPDIIDRPAMAIGNSIQWSAET